MFAYLLILTAATLVPLESNDRTSVPVPTGNPGAWVSTIDYPSMALSQMREGTTGFNVTVGPDGRVTDCTITASSGSPDLDQATCTNVKRRARFSPAMDKNGNPTIGRYANRIRWQIPSLGTIASFGNYGTTFPHGPILNYGTAVTVPDADYPAGALSRGESGEVQFALSIDEKGSVSNCTASEPVTFKELAEKSCQVARNWKFSPAENETGKAVAGTGIAAIRWRLPSSGQVPAKLDTQMPPRPLITANGFKTQMSFTQKSDGTIIDCATEQSGTSPNPMKDTNCEFQARAMVRFLEPMKPGDPDRRIKAISGVEIEPLQKPKQ